jgi:hypothetical protein
MARSGVIYGESGSYKSTSAAHFSRYIYEVTGKRTLLFSLDGGGWGPMDPEIQAGLILPYRCNIQVPLPVIRKISQGYWPERPEETSIAATNLRAVNWQEFGGMVVEGMTSISQALMRHLADQGIKTGEEATNQFAQNVMVDGVKTAEKFAGNSRGHYGFVQNQLYSMVMNFTGLPCHYVLFTALESRTEEDDRTTIYGPAVAGKKATAMVPSWVGDCIHSQTTPVKRSVQVPDPADPKKLVDSEVVDTVARMYFMKHPDPATGIMFPAKPRVSPERVADLLRRYPGGYFEPTPQKGFDEYLRTVDERGKSQAESVTKWRDEVDQRFRRGKWAATAAEPQPAKVSPATPVSTK